MPFSTKISETFGRTIDTSPYVTLDPLVKQTYVSKGRNIIFGRQTINAEASDLLYLGKVLESGTGTSYLGSDAWLDTSFPHVVYITGTRGSGKSVDLGILIEGLSRLKTASPVQRDVTPIASFLIDTQSQFWTLRFSPKDDLPIHAAQKATLDEWNLSPSELADVKFFVPPGATRFLGDEEPLQIRPKDVLHEEWCSLLGQEIYGPQGHILAKTLERFAGSDYSVEEMITYIASAANWPGVAEGSRKVLQYRLEDYQRTGLFSKDGLDISALLVGGRCNVFMLRELRDEDKALVTAILARQLFTTMGRYHQKRRVDEFFSTGEQAENFPSRVWLLIDEAHVVCPSQGSSPGRAALVEYVKRGRDAGLSLVLATQQPSAVDDRVLSQVNISLAHRLSFSSDIAASISRIPTKTLSGMRVSATKLTDFGDMVRLLDAGQCFIGDQGTSRVVLLQMRPRITAHAGYSPL
ncbi:hypothetical protein [Brevundimonas sp.]|uniref:ATP-binding protein n=1 Tax=Brevundimonas sp. TaxID=1871086 RepID=UPI002D2A5471|nr:hypothetical protein [Brevundimonas sp.]HYC68892.1 hypothetical protein [Brevundimonas sp.]